MISKKNVTVIECLAIWLNGVWYTEHSVRCAAYMSAWRRTKTPAILLVCTSRLCVCERQESCNAYRPTMPSPLSWTPHFVKRIQMTRMHVTALALHIQHTHVCLPCASSPSTHNISLHGQWLRGVLG